VEALIAKKKQQSKKKKKTKPCPTCGALIVDHPANRWQHRSRRIRCKMAYERQSR